MRSPEVVAPTACPGCGTSLPRAATRVASREATPLHECTSCWSIRARALARAREPLQARGELGRDACGLPTWRGDALLGADGDEDALEGAVVSELLRQCDCAEASRACRLTLRLSERAVRACEKPTPVSARSGIRRRLGGRSEAAGGGRPPGR